MMKVLPCADIKRFFVQILIIKYNWTRDWARDCEVVPQRNMNFLSSIVGRLKEHYKVSPNRSGEFFEDNSNEYEAKVLDLR